MPWFTAQQACIPQFHNWQTSEGVNSESRMCRKVSYCKDVVQKMVKDQSTRLVRVLETSHVATLDDQSRRWPVVVVNWQTSATYCGDRPA